MTPVLDASALIAFLNHETGHERVEELLDSSVVSTVNLAEVATFLTRAGHPDPTSATRGLARLGIQILPFSAEDAERAAALWTETRRSGLSLGDLACLAVTQRSGGIAVTTDRAWTNIDVDVKVELIR